MMPVPIPAPREEPTGIEWLAEPDCRFCEDVGEVDTGRTEHDTGHVITAPCPMCGGMW